MPYPIDKAYFKNQNQVSMVKILKTKKEKRKGRDSEKIFKY